MITSLEVIAFCLDTHADFWLKSREMNVKLFASTQKKAFYNFTYYIYDLSANIVIISAKCTTEFTTS